MWRSLFLLFLSFFVVFVVVKPLFVVETDGVISRLFVPAVWTLDRKGEGDLLAVSTTKSWFILILICSVETIFCC